MNEEKFTGKAGVYAKYRPSYPNSFIDYLYSQVGFAKDSFIADIGSGTGILTELLLKQKSFVYGVEPNEDMRNSAKETLAGYNNYKPVNASAENTTLSTACVDYITAAQAFHWFDRKKFKAECQRILKNQGKVILVWNSYDSESELVMENDLINREYCPSFKGFSGGVKNENPEEYSDFFKYGNCEYKKFNHDLFFDEDSFIGRNLSASYAPKENDSNYLDYISKLKELYKKYNRAGSLCLKNVTRSYVGEV